MTNLLHCAGSRTGTHDWMPISHWHEYELVGGGPVEGSKVGSYRLGERVDHFYIIKACRDCTDVWWQEYDPRHAVMSPELP